MRRLFISDLHLQPERPEITRAFHHFIEHIAPGSDALYLLGDIFEYWIGDDCPLPGLEPVTEALAALSQQGCRLYFQHGNRDFLVADAYAARIGASLLPEKHRIELPQGQALLMHGDQLCTDDLDYLQFRTLVRDPAWQAQFLGKPVAERIAIARQLREQSAQQGAMKSDAIMDVNPDAVRNAMRETEASILIHGHTHRPAIHQDQIAPGVGERIVLGAWSAAGWYLEVTDTGRQLIHFSPDATSRS